MTKSDVRDMAASVKQRLLNVHTENNIDFNFLLTRYAVERFLHRLDRSRYKESFVLKGAMLFMFGKANGSARRGTSIFSVLRKTTPKI